MSCRRSGDRTVVVWTRGAEGAMLPTSLRCHAHIAWQVAFSPNGKRFTTVAEDGTAVVFDTCPLREVACFAPLVGMRAVSFVSDDQLLCGGGDGSIFVVRLCEQ